MQDIHNEVTQLRRQMAFFRVYAIVTSVFILAFIGYGFRKSAQDDIIKSLRAEKIEIVEPDGTVKLSLFNKENLPPAVVNGKKMSRQGGDEAGLMFYNTEGEECGGLVYNGKGKNGKGQNELSITFDKYKQDQVVQLSYIQRESGDDTKGLTVFERPSFPVDQTMATLDSIRSKVKGEQEQQQVINKLKADGYFGYTRMFAGQQGQRTGVFVRDTKGRIRLEMIVNEKNEPEILFYNEKGEIHKKINY
ncbi:hypothetical protein [Chitinophaga pinensis]|uniref:Uncharacterized protein n=1 Tax=Chitinophaga pinensis (strain ATCC 43595 / DSM 2588 / LMG 13176 / NBRC 15968 / NCIMB 11800 / UQM 2034) TaxID=485918 RepID=A0A979GSA3_CHIPD|nr:hypothetical protein [Chitinophaga pinensis]ACU59046.1 hypothetical protein Cpin_1550 [Chitinophaga pinensis DSM 2588]